MERKIFILIIIVYYFIFHNAGCNNKIIIYQAYISGDMLKWKTTIDLLIKNDDPTDPNYLEYINYFYGYIAWCLGNDHKMQAEKYLKIAEKKIAQLENSENILSYVYSYKAAFLGFRIGLNLWRAPFLGPKSIEYAKKALELDQNNPMVHIENGNIALFMPGFMGGSKKEALRYYLEALDIMETEPELIHNNWNYINLLVMIAQVYEKLDKLHEAKKYYEKILNFEPNMLWVKNNLYPNLLKK